MISVVGGCCGSYVFLYLIYVHAGLLLKQRYYVRVPPTNKQTNKATKDNQALSTPTECLAAHASDGVDIRNSPVRFWASCAHIFLFQPVCRLINPF